MMFPRPVIGRKSSAVKVYVVCQKLEVVSRWMMDPWESGVMDTG